MEDFTKKRICGHLAEMDLPMEPTFELRKINFFESATPEFRQMILHHFQTQAPARVYDWPEPYLAMPKQRPSPDCAIDRLSYKDEALLHDIFNTENLNRILQSADEFNEYYKLFTESEKKPAWDLIRVLASDTWSNYCERQKIYEGLLNGGLTARVNSGEIIRLDEDVYRLPQRFNIEKFDKNAHKGQIHCFSARFYISLGENLAEYWCKLNQGKISELAKIQYSSQINTILHEALIRGELPVHRHPTFSIVKYNYRSCLTDDAIYWHEIKPILEAAGIGMPDEPVFMESFSKTVKQQAEVVGNSDKGKFEHAETTKWKGDAWKIGEAWMKEQRQKGKNPGVIEIAKHVEGELSNQQITGKRGKFLDWETIKREALTGITGKPANGKGQKRPRHIGESPAAKAIPQ